MRSIKKILVTAFLCLGIYMALQAQITLSLGSQSVCNIGDSITIPVNVTGFTSVGSLSIKITYNPAILSFGRTLNWNPSFHNVIQWNNATTGTLAESWTLAGAPVTMADGKLFEIKFKCLGGTSTINFLLTNGATEITSQTGVPYIITSASGGVGGQSSPLPVITGILSYCAGSNTVLSTGEYSSWLWAGGATTQSITATAGSYSVTVTDENGCSGMSALAVVTENPVFDIASSVEICNGDSVFLSGHWQSAGGIFYDTLSSANGCDSIVATNLMVHQPYLVNRTFYLCNGDSVFLSGGWQTAGGAYYDTLQTLSGCDSIIVTDLTIHPSYLINRTSYLCNGDSVFVEGAYQTESGDYTDLYSTALGCDSIIITHLTVNPVYQENKTVQICPGGSYYAGGAFQTTAGIYTDNYNSVQGCDSIVITELIVTGHIVNNIFASICDGDSYYAGGALQTESGTYLDSLTAALGCDSTVITTLTVNPVFTVGATATICEGDSIFLEGSYRTGGGVYVDSLATISGCDSIIITTLTVNQTATVSATAAICDGDSLFVGGSYQTLAGDYYDVYAGANGCDSTVVTALTVIPTETVTASAAICEGDSIIIGGAYQSTGGIYTVTYSSVLGCDSIEVTELIVNPVYSTPGFLQICTGDSAYLGGSWRNEPGMYTDTYSTPTGCDSIVITDLLVLDHIVVNSEAWICPGDSVFAGGANQTGIGVYIDSLAAVYGCDSSVITTVYVYELPEVDLGQDTLVVIYPNVVVLNAGTHTTYEWSDGSAYQTLQVDSTGWYSVTVTDNSCGIATDSIYVDYIIFVITTERDSPFVVYPNPSAGQVFISNYNGSAIDVYDVVGRKVLKIVDNKTKPLSIDLSNYEDGTYLIKLKTGKAVKIILKKEK